MKKTVRKPSNTSFIIAVIFAVLFVSSYLFLSSNPWKRDGKKNDEKSVSIFESCKVTCDKVVYYEGDYLEPEVTVEYEGKILIEDVDYEVKYYNNVFPGNGSIILSGIGDYSGVHMYNFEITYGDDVCDNPDNSELVEYVNSWFTNMYRRLGTRDEIVFWVNSIYDGSFDLELFVNSVIYNRDMNPIYFTNEEFVENVYATFLKRGVDPDGLDNWMTALEEHQLSKYDVAINIVSSAEFSNIISFYGK